MSEARPTKDTIYIDVDDDITSIIDKLEGSTNKIVALVLPKRSTVLQSIVNMRLLKRSADKANKNVVLITGEAALLPLAGAAGLHVAKNLQSKPVVPPSPNPYVQEEPELPGGEEEAVADEPADEPSAESKINYNKPIGELAAMHALDEDTISLDDIDEPSPASKAAVPKVPKNKSLKVPNFEKFRLLIGAGIVALIGLIFFIILAIWVLPKATVTIQTSATPVTAQFNLNTSDTAKSLDTTKGIIPAQLKLSDQTSNQQVTATGQQNNGTKATGSVKITNCTDSAVTIPAGSGVSTGGLTYITQNTISLHSGNFTSGGSCQTSGSHIDTVPVKSQQGGSKYNISSGQSCSVAGQPSGVTGTNSSAFTGGTDNNVTVLSQQDIDNAKQKITSGDSDSFTKTFEKQLSDSGFYVLSSTLKIKEPTVTSTPDVGQPASTANVTIKITYSVVVVSKDDLRTAIEEKLAGQVDKTKQKLSVDDVLKTASIEVQNQSSDTKMTLAITEDSEAVPIINVDDVKKMVEGKKKGDIKTAVSSITGVQNVDVKMSPFWVSKAPKKPNKIIIKLQPVKSNND